MLLRTSSIRVLCHRPTTTHTSIRVHRRHNPHLAHRMPARRPLRLVMLRLVHSCRTMIRFSRILRLQPFCQPIAVWRRIFVQHKTKKHMLLHAYYTCSRNLSKNDVLPTSAIHLFNILYVPPFWPQTYFNPINMFINIPTGKFIGTSTCIELRIRCQSALCIREVTISCSVQHEVVNATK